MRRSSMIAAAFALAACSSAPPAASPVAPRVDTPPAASARPAALVTPDAEFREKAPAPGADVVFVPPKIEEARLANGVRVLVVERHDLPIVAVDIAIDGGADQARPAIGSFTGAMLMAGTKTRSALQLSDELEGLGARYGASVGSDQAEISAQVLAPKLSAVLSVLADVVQNPVFDAQELERERSKRLTSLAQESDSPTRLLGKTVMATLYPAGHPYATTLLGDEASLKKLTRGDLVSFYADHFAPSRTTVAFAGDITKAQAVAEAERAFGAWKGSAKKARVPGAPPPPAAKDPRIIVIDRPGATQSSVAVAIAGAPRTSPDFDALVVMSSILGGQFTSRMNLNLREKHAYTYGVRSSFDFRHGPGPFTAGGAIFRESTAAGVREMLAEIGRMRSEPVGAEELADAKAYLVKQLPARFESTSSTASALAELSVYGLPLDEYATRPARFGKITSEDVKRVAEKYLPADRLRIVIVGDAAVIQSSLEGLGVGAVEVRGAAKKPTGG